MTQPVRAPVKAVLFDLDGTLIDSAPDLAGAANDMRLARGLEALPYAALRPMVGSGARGMVGKAFDAGPHDAEFESLRAEFLDVYEARMLRQTQVFDAMWPLLNGLDEHQLPWGIVTNKAARFARPVVQALELHIRSKVLVCGDTTAHAKPHPAPLLEAARQLDLPATQCIYVGDDLRDVQAGRAAGMRTFAAAWGYLGEGDRIEAWGADFVLNDPAALLNWLELA